ncbi:tetratricopeptide repeat protein [Chitinophaga sp.]|uniref:tetratricopeptide repeat protein n=1 Tax=Chitinophaga sp. TaxID=1869181 RepID=UPI0031CE4007
MTENAPHEQEHEVPDACFQCNSPDYEPGYQVKLCKTCRKRFSRYPLKKNILLGAIGLGILFALSLYKFPSQYKAAITYEKGIAFADNREFMSAENAFIAVLRVHPAHEKSKVHLLTAYYYNNKTGEALQLLAQLDKNPAYKINPELEDEVETVREMWLKDKGQEQLFNTASGYFSDNRFHEADSLFKKIIRDNPTNFRASSLYCIGLRQEKKYKEALTEVNRVLSYNHQLPQALAEKAVILLMLKKDKEALALAEQTSQSNPFYNTGWFTLGVARYCNNDIEGAMEAYHKMKGLTVDTYHPADSLLRIITQHINFRNL